MVCRGGGLKMVNYFYNSAPVAQLDRAVDFYSAGHRCESCRADLVSWIAWCRWWIFITQSDCRESDAEVRAMCLRVFRKISHVDGDSHKVEHLADVFVVV